ncbi:MAG: AAA family ATPase [Euryarchaeota archaeon]|nr:AAA family ATPase [Euryarchaeota archaeon]
MRRLRTGLGGLDLALGGGIPVGRTTHLWGEGGSGKTTVALWIAAVIAAAGVMVLYIDTEGVPLDRLAQLVDRQRGDLDRVLRRFSVASPRSLEAQELAVERACSSASAGETEVGLIVVDSATALYRLCASPLGGQECARQSLERQLWMVAAAARDGGIPALVTNQVKGEWRSGTLAPLCPALFARECGVSIWAERWSGSLRRLHVEPPGPEIPGRHADLDLRCLGWVPP